MKNIAYNTAFRRSCLSILALIALAGCAARQAQDSLAGSTAQKLVAYSIDDLGKALPESDFSAWAGKRVFMRSSFPASDDLRGYADHRLAVELASRFDIEIVFDEDAADATLNVFYTSLGTDRGTKGFFLPLGFVPGMDAESRINLLTLEQFQGVAEMYYFIGETGSETRGRVLSARTRSDALGLPIITIPINTIDRD